ncbi:MAG TPA: V-type ATP synthase subunit K [Candidatus Ozemobacteraceae bacterium]|nr:V-type ATP synthase subunit K [Candidatus Ozemobacteraceae bacterium]HQG27913.1 V-type ATP synthase subunit K [Candidatus Ozemobacteraceae bacterium]
MIELLGKFACGLVLGLGGIGSCLGIVSAGTAAAGAWASEGKAGKNLSFQYIIMVAAPISQTLYAMIVMLTMIKVAGNPENALLCLGVALGTGIIELFSAWYQGLIGAAGIRAMVENGGKGFGLLIIALGIIETVGIFGMVFGLQILNSDLAKAAITAGAAATGAQ